jgi:hypothetical protein
MGRPSLLEMSSQLMWSVSFPDEIIIINKNEIKLARVYFYIHVCTFRSIYRV